jgi:hypothetical protein
MAKEHDSKKVEVAVITTAGSYPQTGFEEVPENQKLDVILRKAAHELHIADTSGWVAKINGTAVDTTKSYAELGLRGEVEIDYGRSEGGGGSYARSTF